MSDNNVQEDFEVTKQAMLAYEVKIKREIVMVTKEDLEKARVAYEKANEASWATKEAFRAADTESAFALMTAADAHHVAAWDKLNELYEAYENGN